MALRGVTGEMGVKKNLLLHLIYAAQLKIGFRQTPSHKTTHIGEILQTCNKIRLLINKITLLVVLCAHCRILQEMFSLSASVYGKRTGISTEREKKNSKLGKAFFVSTTILIALAISLGNKKKPKHLLLKNKRQKEHTLSQIHSRKKGQISISERPQ